jgi:hypothetical protein
MKKSTKHRAARIRAATKRHGERVKAAREKVKGR